MTAKNYVTKEIKNEFLKKEEVIPVLFNWNNNGYTTWISLNDKEVDSIKGVVALQDTWIDIDSRPKGVDDRLATREEMQEAIERTIKLKNFIENQYAAIGFTANSGNGFHIHFPLPRFEIPAELRESVNKKMRLFAKSVSKFVNAKIDNTYDISRRTTLIGTKNNKIPEFPLPTLWDKELLKNGLQDALIQVEKARKQNTTLLEAILLTEEPTTKTEKYVAPPKENHIDIEQLCQISPKVYTLYKVANGENQEYKKFGYKSRSEAEAGLITILAMEGFGDKEIYQIMDNCTLGKWQEKGDSYKTLTIEHARQQAHKYIKEKETTNQLMLDIANSTTGTSGLAQQQQETQISMADINPVLIAKKKVEQYNFVMDQNTKILWVYDNKQGIYTEDSEEVIKCEIVKLLDNYAKARFYIDVDFWIRYTAPRVKMNPHPELIGVQNGVLNVITKELKPYDQCKDLYVTVKIPTKYDKNMQCPKITQFLNEILDTPNRNLAQEFIGYCLLLDHRYKKAYIATGPTDTGKTVHQNLNTQLLGEENVTNQTLQAINHNRFSPAELFNKMANFCDDMPAGIVKVTGNFKMATGNGRLSAERKGKDPFNFHNHAKFWLNCNQLPPVQKSEDCDAYYNRLIIVDYNRKIPKEKQNPNLINELTTPEEMSGYLNYALEGLQRLLKNKRFSETLTKEDIRDIYIKRTDSAKYFVENFVTVTDEYSDFIFHEDLFREAIKKCHQEKIRPMKKAELNTAMQYHCTGAQSTKIRPAPKSSLQPAWRYVKLRFVEPKSEGQSRLDTETPKNELIYGMGKSEKSENKPENWNLSEQTRQNTELNNEKIAVEKCKNNIEGVVPNVPFVPHFSNSSVKNRKEKDNNNFVKAKNIYELRSHGTNGTNGTNSKNTIYYRLLAPTEAAPCDGESQGGSCGLEAKYEVDGYNYCQKHFEKIKANCEYNGFTLVEECFDGEDY